ncbi:MAG: trypsin-like serine protease [Chloroflexaceae bacterium]|nr:trypsin-like serine protease [Chloroflexaceae bacterium]
MHGGTYRTPWKAIIVALLLGSLMGTATGWLLAQFMLPWVASTTVLPLPTTTSTDTLETRITAVYRQAGTGVVNITTRSFDYDFFLRPVPREGSGSGFFYDKQGHIVTNYHVIQDAEEMIVTLADGQTLPARVVGLDPSNDLAVIVPESVPDQFTVLPMGQSDTLRVGQFVVAIGNPFGLERTLTAGVISSLGRVIQSPNERFIGEIVQTDAPINPGNSGGPLLNLNGEVIGVNSAILSPSGTSAGIGFAIPTSTVQRVVPALIEQGHYRHPSLNAQLFELTPEWIRLLRSVGMDIPVEQGLLVVEATQTSNGLRGGSQLVRVGNALMPVGGDIIIAIEGQPVIRQRDLMVYLETQTTVGQQVDVTVIREGVEQMITVTLQRLGE